MRWIALLALVAVALAVGACGGGEDKTTAPETVIGTTPAPSPEEPPPAEEPPAGSAGDPAAGKEVFASAGCGSCHTLADAGTTGAVGPNLDDAKPPLERVVDRVTNGKGAMPAFADTLSEQQIADVAAYVVQAASG